MGAPRARAELVSDLVLGLQHPYRPREPGDPGECPTITPTTGPGALGILRRLRLKAGELI